MAKPLSPLSPSDANRSTAATLARSKTYTSPTKHAFESENNENQPLDSPMGPPSSPFIADVEPSPPKAQTPSRIRSPKKGTPSYSPRRLTEDALRENEGLTRTIKIAESPSNQPNHKAQEDDTNSTMGGAHGFAGMDDTCFSAFSAVPNADMTRFANLGLSPAKSATKSPSKLYDEEGQTPRPTSRNTQSRGRQNYDDSCSSPTPRRHKSNREGDTTNLLVDFTDQFNFVSHNSGRSPTRNGCLSPNKYPTAPDLASYASGRRTPSPQKCPLPQGTPSEARQLANLLDFDLPPAPTPRSIPSISARELEGMKSAFQSQISSFKAEISGREAEIRSLNDAVADAERRVGEALEEVRNERGAKQNLQGEKADWEKRQQEMQGVLKDVKEEIIRGDREKDALLQTAQEAEHKREEAENRAVEAESKLEGMRASPSSMRPSESGNANAEVEAAVTKVAKELHTLYKSKHEAKVTALKKSYSDRWEKKIKDLTSKCDDLAKENEDLRIGRDATMSHVLPAPSSTHSHPSPPAQDHTQQLETLHKDLTTLRSDLASQKEENQTLSSRLADSRAETADLIAATEELMALSVSQTQPAPDSSNQDPLRSSLSRSTSNSGSGLKAPGFGSGAESRIGRMAGGAAGFGAYAAGSGYGSKERDRSGSGLGSRSGIMSNIERMGRGRTAE